MAGPSTADAYDPLGDTYAPEFEIRVRGRELERAVKADVLSVKVDMDLENLDRFEITVNNWDDERIFYKYSDDPAAFDVGDAVMIELGYAGARLGVMHGLIESFAPKFPESGSPTLVVGGSSSLARLRGRKPGPDEQKLFENLADYEIAQMVAARNGLRAEVTAEGPKRDVVWQRDLDDALFLMECAKRVDFDLFVQLDPDTQQDVLHFIKPRDLRESGAASVHVFEYAVGSTHRRDARDPVRELLGFTPRLNAARQVASVTVRGWDPSRKEPIEAKADAASLPGAARGKSGPDRAGRKGDEVVDATVTSQDEAQRLAESLLRSRAYEFITGEGRVVGFPELRPGHNVELRGLGSRFSGAYYVKTVTHQMGADGFSTSFGVRRVFEGEVS